MSYYDNSNNPNKQPQGYWDQGAAARAQEAATFRYWNDTLFKVGQKKP